MDHVNLNNKYEEYLNSSGDPITRLRLIGYPVASSNIKISSLEEFRAVVSSIDIVKIEDLKKDIKKCFKNNINRGDLLHLLKNGEYRLDDYEGAEFMKILPLDSEGGINVDTFVDFLYK